MPRIVISDPQASKLAHGYPVTGEFRTVLPMHADVEHVRFVDAWVLDSVPALPADVDAWLEARLTKHTRGAPVSDAEQIKRRLAAVGTPKTRLEYRRALEAYAIPVEWLPESPERDAAAEEETSLYPWGEEGHRLDEGAAEDQARREAEAAAEAERARLAAMPNTKTLRELGFVGVFLPLGTTPSSWPRRLLQQGGDFAFSEAFVTDAMSIEGGKMVLFDAMSVLGLEWREGKIPGSTASIVSSYVPERAPAKGRRMVNVDAWLDLRMADDSPVTSFRDARTEDGRDAEDAFRALMQPFMSRVVSDDEEDRRCFSRLFFQAAVRGFGLRPELVKATYREMVAELPCMPGRPDPQTYAASEARVAKHIEEAIAGKRAWFACDELFASDEPTKGENAETLDRVLDRALEGKSEVTTEELEEALLEAGAIAKPLSTAGHQRLLARMSERGFDKRQVTRDGKRPRVFVRRPEGEHKVSFAARVKSALGMGE